MKLIRKEALRQHLKHSGVRMTVVDEEELVAQLLNDPDVCFQTNQLIRVLDVGSCGFLFAGCEEGCTAPASVFEWLDIHSHSHRHNHPSQSQSQSQSPSPHPHPST